MNFRAPRLFWIRLFWLGVVLVAFGISQHRHAVAKATPCLIRLAGDPQADATNMNYFSKRLLP